MWKHFKSLIPQIQANNCDLNQLKIHKGWRATISFTAIHEDSVERALRKWLYCVIEHKSLMVNVNSCAFCCCLCEKKKRVAVVAWSHFNTRFVQWIQEIEVQT